MSAPIWPWIDTNLPAPDWRHRIALRRSARSSEPPADHDADDNGALIRAATRYYAGLRIARCRAQRRQCAARMPVMAAVHDLFSQRRDLREIVELRLLAGTNPILIGLISGIDPRVVAVYHDLYFDVASHLNRSDYMLGTVLRPSEVGADAAARRRWALRLLAWLGGEQAVESLVCPLQRCAAVPGERPRSCGALLADTTQAVHLRELTLALLAAKFDDRRAGRLADHFAAAAIKRAEPAGDPGTRRYLDNVQVFLDHVKFTTGPRSLDHVPPEQRKYYEGPVEPSNEEWAALARGEPVPTLDAKIAMSEEARRERESRRLPSPGT
jgi:hypothetical protein